MISRTADQAADHPATRRDELRTFIFLAVFLAPILSVAIVGSYGFIIWISQMLVGPPTG